MRRSNQSRLHKELTKKTAPWLANKVTQRGMHWQQEFTLTSGMRCDAVAYGSLQYQWFEKLDGKKPVKQYMFAFETKVTVDDFYSTFKYDNHKVTKLKPFANLHFLVIPRNTFHNIEIPEFYGILLQRGRGLTLAKEPQHCIIDPIYFYENAYNMMFRLQSLRNYMRFYEKMI